jgi:hypothetical protein
MNILKRNVYFIFPLTWNFQIFLKNSCINKFFRSFHGRKVVVLALKLNLLSTKINLINFFLSIVADEKFLISKYAVERGIQAD